MSYFSIQSGASLLLLCLISLFVTWFLSAEKYLYFWDNLNFYSLYTELGAKFLESPLKAIDSINVSVRKADYNNLGTVPLLPFYYLFGSGRSPFILAIAIIYAFSAIVFFPKVLEKIDDSGERFTLFLIGLISLGLLPQYWIPVLLGYYDVAGVGIIFLILFLYFRRQISEQSLKGLIVMGLLLMLLVVLRRWYAYWVVGFFAAMFMREIWLGAEQKTGFKTRFKNMSIIALTAVISYFAVATQNALKILITDYADIYSAYRISKGWWQIAERFYSHFGLLTLFFSAGGLVTTLFKKELRSFGIFFGVLFLSTFCAFNSTQDLDFHHFYWVISVFVVFIAVFVTNVYRLLPHLWLKVSFLLFFTTISVANFSVVFFQSAENDLSFAFSKTRFYPKVRNDLEQIRQMLLELENLTANSDKRIYVLSSSVTLNSSVLQSGAAEFDLLDLKKRILSSSDVDKRDGFPFQIYRADFVVIANPIGYHLAEKDQRVIGVPAEEITNGRGIGEAFEKLPLDYVLEDNRQVLIYRKNRKFRPDALQKMSDVFVGFYPEHKSKFEIKPEIVKELSE